MKLRQVISENSSVSIGLLITIMGGVFWISTLYARTDSNTTALERIASTLTEMNTRLSRLEGEVHKFNESN